MAHKVSFLGKSKSAADLKHADSKGALLMAERKEFPTSAEDYELLEECGRGVSATVWRGVCKPLNEEVAVKLLDLENMNCSLEEIIRETQVMRQLHHPNVLPLHCSFVHKQNLWMVEPYVSGGSVLNIMKYAYPEGLEEPVIATILKVVLKGLEYIHRHGCIHRDVKAGNILIDKDGHVYLADFGVAATMERTGSWGHAQAARSTFVGTPCWMAPEVMEQAQGYNELADIWSFGITILELAHGHAPFARLPPMKVLLMTIQNPPPTLESDSGKKHFSKAMRDIVAKCLVKDPQKRPTASQLLEHKFFKTAHDSSYLVKHMLAGLPPLGDRVQQMRLGISSVEAKDNLEMQKSQEAYMKGVTSWNFDVQALKEKAAAESLSMEHTGEAVHVPVSHPPQLPTIADAAPLVNGDEPLLQHPPSLAPTTTPAPATRAPSAPMPSIRPLTVDTTAASAAKPPVAQSPSHARSDSSEKLGTPGRGKPQQSLTATKSIKGTIRKKQGRFDVWEGDGPPPDEDALAAADGKLQRSTGSGSDSEIKAAVTEAGELIAPSSIPTAAAPAKPDKPEVENPEKAKRKGRFHIVEDDFADGKKSVPRTSSTVSMQDTRSTSSVVPSAPAQPIHVVLGPLKEMQDTIAGHYDLIKELVVAVQDAERGKYSHLNAVLQERQHLKVQREEPDKLRAQVSALQGENSKLKDKVRLLEEELRRVDITATNPEAGPRAGG